MSVAIYFMLCIFRALILHTIIFFISFKDHYWLVEFSFRTVLVVGGLRLVPWLESTIVLRALCSLRRRQLLRTQSICFCFISTNRLKKNNPLISGHNVYKPCLNLQSTSTLTIFVSCYFILLLKCKKCWDQSMTPGYSLISIIVNVNISEIPTARDTSIHFKAIYSIASY